MKTFYLALCLCFCFVEAYSQVSSLNEFKPTQVDSISVADVVYQDFYVRSNIAATNPEVSRLSYVKRYKLTSPTFVSFEIPLSNNPNYNSIDCMYNLSTKDYVYNYASMIVSKGVYKTRVFDSTGMYLYMTVTDGKTYDIIFPDQTTNRSPFSNCMHALEEDYEQTFSGWILWNCVASTQVVAAAVCQACVWHWYKCKYS